MRVYTYYTPISLYDEDSQRRLIDVWARSWSKQGWEPIVLNEGDCVYHPLYEEYKRRVFSLPTEYGNEYDGQCFMRWLAMANQLSGPEGGGMMTDYDVINYGLKPISPEPDKMQIFCENPPVPVDMGAVLGPRKLYDWMAKIYLGWKPDAGDWNDSSTYHGYHCSDLSLIVRMFEHKNFPKPNWLEKRFGHFCRFPHECYKTADLVHYGYDMKPAGFWPKWAHIEKVRAF
jgi:hypothetical protein